MKRGILALLICALLVLAVLPMGASAWELKCDSCTDGKCTDCGGDGKVTCTTRCNGTGKIDCVSCVDGRLECTACTEETRNDCNKCYGGGHLVCSECGGAGTFVCTACQGSGEVDCNKCVVSAGADMLGKCTVCGGDGRVAGGEGEPTADDLEKYGDRIIGYTAPQPDNNQNGGQTGTAVPPAGNDGNTVTDTDTDNNNNNTDNTENNNTDEPEEGNELWEELNEQDGDRWAVDFVETANDNTERISVSVIISTENSEAVKGFSDKQISDLKEELEALLKTVSFEPSADAAERFKAAAGAEQELALSFEGQCEIGFDVAVTVLLKEATLSADQEYYAYRYDEETETFEKQGLVTLATQEDGVELIFTTDGVSDFFISSVDLSAEPDTEAPETIEPTANEKTEGKAGGLPQSVQYAILFITMVAAAAGITVISVKVINR